LYSKIGFVILKATKVVYQIKIKKN